VVEISEIDGCPILKLDDTSLIGTWCDYELYSGSPSPGVVDEEFTFAVDKSFVWRRLGFGPGDTLTFPRAEGSWSLEGEVLKLNIESQEGLDEFPSKRIHFAVRMRENNGRRQLVMESVLYEEQEGRCCNAFPFEATPGEAEENHAEYQAKRKKKNTLDGPFKDLVAILNKAIPAAVEQLQIPEPIFCVRLYFHDTHAPAEDYCCSVRCIAESARQRIVQANDPSNIPDALWHPTLGIANELSSGDNGVYEADLTSHAELVDLYAQVYTLLAESEEENLPKFRTALRRVSMTLHMVKWPATVLMSDDFVVFPADGSNFFGGEYEEDMKASIPGKRLELLVKRGFMAE